MNLLVILACFVVPSLAQTQPNIVFIFLDDMGWNDVGYHGSEIMTPAIDDLAAQGLKLENYYVQPICSPTRGTFLTGRYPIHTCILRNAVNAEDIGGLSLSETLLFEKMKEAGYSTHVVGKWHLGYSSVDFMPTFRGADTFYGCYNGFHDYYAYEHCAATNSSVCGIDLHDDVGDTLTPVGSENGTYSTFLYTQKAVELIENHNTEEPFFLYLAYTAVHSPLQAPQEYIDMYPDIEGNRKTYAAMVTCADDGIANVTNALQEAGMWNNTILIFSSDNGGGNAADNDPLRDGKGSYFNGGVQAVGFVASPLLTATGVNYTGLIHVTDWFPTFVNLAGGNVEDLELDGLDIWDSLSENTESPRVEILHDIDSRTRLVGNNTYPDIFDVRVQAALRSGEWKIMTGFHGNRSSDINLRLFNIAEDPTESTEVSSLYPEIVESLLERLAVYNQTAVPICTLTKDLEGANPANHGGFWMPWL